MIYLAAISLIVITLAVALSPRGELTHAAVSSRVFRRQRWFPLAGLYRDTNGRSIDLDDKIITKAVGPSALKFGIPDGALVIGERVHLDRGDVIEPGQVVIINSETDDGERPQRFRCVERVDEDGTVHFISSRRSYRAKPSSDILARVTYVSA